MTEQTESGPEVVHHSLDDHVVTITLDRPDRRNAIDGAMRRQINAAFDRFRADEDAAEGAAAFRESRPPVWRGR